MAHPSPAGGQYRRVILIVLGSCIALVLIDLLGGLLRRPQTLSAASVVLKSAGWSYLAFLLVYGAAVLVVGPYLIFVARLNPVRCAVSFSTLWITGLVASSVTLGAQMPRSGVEMRTFMYCGLVAFVAGCIAYPIASQLSRVSSGWERRAFIALLVLATVFVGLWLRRHGGGGIVALLVALALVCFFLIVATDLSNSANSPRRGVLTIAWSLAIVVCFGLGALRSRQNIAASATSISEKRVPRVIMIVVDTLRSDALSCYGQTAIQTPHIDRLAEQSIRFAHAVSAAPWTVPGTASLMTGLSPLVHGASVGGGHVSENIITLAEYFEDAGYRTSAIGHNPHLSPLISNLGQGFDEYDMFPRGATDTFGDKLVATLFLRFMGKEKEITTTELTDMAIDWVDKHSDEPFFFWLHYFDPHLPYAPPAKYLEGTQRSPLIDDYFVDMPAIRSGYLVPDAADRERIRQLYLGEVRYVDDQVNRFIEFLTERDLFDDALIILTSDHGEEFWEHNGYEHGHSVHREVIDVPLIIKSPQSAAVGVVEHPVSTEAVTPTILQICGIDLEADSLSSRSLTPLMMDSEESEDVPNPAPILTTGLIYYENRVGLRFNGLKYIHRLMSGHEELYDLSADPDEQHNLLPLEDETSLLTARALEAERRQDANRLKEFWELGEPEVVEIDDATRRRLKSLGYVGD